MRGGFDRKSQGWAEVDRKNGEKRGKKRKKGKNQVKQKTIFGKL